MLRVRNLTKTVMMAACTAALLTSGETASAKDFYEIGAKKQVMIDEHQVCRSVKNRLPYPMFIPTKTAQEWSVGQNAFLADARDYTIVRPCVSLITYALWSPHYTDAASIPGDPSSAYTVNFGYDTDDFPEGVKLDVRHVYRVDMSNQRSVNLADYFSHPSRASSADIWQDIGSGRIRTNFYRNLSAAFGESYAKRADVYFVLYYSRGHGTNYNYRTLKSPMSPHKSASVPRGNKVSLPSKVKALGPFDVIQLPPGLKADGVTPSLFELTGSDVRALTNRRNVLNIEPGGAKFRSRLFLNGASYVGRNTEEYEAEKADAFTPLLYRHSDVYRFPTGEIVHVSVSITSNYNPLERP